MMAVAQPLPTGGTHVPTPVLQEDKADLPGLWDPGLTATDTLTLCTNSLLSIVITPQQGVCYA